MTDRVLGTLRCFARLATTPCFTLALFGIALLATRAGAQTPPVAHHAGAWTAAAPWPGRSFSNSVWAVHTALTRGDTLFARPHSRVLAWGAWYGTTTDGGLWAWNPTTDVPASANSNLTEEFVARPPLQPFCAGHAALPNGDLLILGGTERDIAGEKLSARFNHQDRSWTSAPLTAPRWYGNATALADGRMLATAGIKYDHMVLFGGRRASDGNVVSDVQRYALTANGDWDPALTGSGPDWPEPREHHTLADQRRGPYYLFGGKGAGNMLNDFWQLRLNDDDNAQSYAWTKVPGTAFVPFNNPPNARWRHVAVVDPDTLPLVPESMYIHGGDNGAATPIVYDDLWKLEWVVLAGRWQWTPLTTVVGPGPGKRTGHTAVWDDANSRMILFGGAGDGGAITNNSVYILRFPGGVPTWSIAPLAAGSAPAPTARTLHAMAADAKLRSPTGSGAEGSWFHTVVFGGQTASGLSNELHELFIEPGTDAVKWIQRTPTGTPPAARTRASVMIYEDYPGTVVILGGELASGAWDATPWETELLATGAWAARATIANALRGQTVLREQRELTALRPEIYDPVANTWSAFGPSRLQTSYHLMVLAADGKLYQSGANGYGTDVTWRMDPASATPTWSQFLVASSDPLDDTITGLLYRPNMLMKCGGTENGSAFALGTSKSVQLDAPSPQWRLSVNGTMGLSRIDHIVNMLPSGEVIAAGGVGRSDLLKDNNPENDDPRKRPELWDPSFTQGGAVGYWYGARSDGSPQLAAEPVARGHHSSAVLLPDGRLLSGGGWDLHPDEVRRSVDQYSPPHLFRGDGTGAFRPRLHGAQDHIAWDQDFKVACPDLVEAACLIRPGATTHAFNQDNRYVPLTVVSQDGHRVTLHSPLSANHAPPGNYLLFVLRTDAVSGKRVPSIARWVNVGATQTTYATWDTLPPAAISNLLVTEVTATSQTLQRMAPADADGVSTGLAASRYELRYRRAAQMPTLEEFFTAGTTVVGLPSPAAPGVVQTFTVSGLEADTYYFRIISRDGAGSDRNWSALSNQAETPQGGGCPFVDTRTAGGWEVENSILGRSLSGALALDSYRLRYEPEVSDGRVRLRVRENEQEHTTLDQLRLIAIDHAPGARAYAVGDRVVLGTRVPARRVTTSAGIDITTRVNGLGTGFAGGPGDTLLVEFAADSPAGAFGATATQNHDPFLEGDGGKCPPDCGGSPLKSPADPMSAAEVDAQVLSNSGLRIEVPDGAGGWQTVATRYPREYFDEAVLDSVGDGPLRLVFVGRHTVHFLGRLRTAAGGFSAHKLPLLAARHTRFVDVSAAVDSIGNLTTELAPGDTVHLEYGWTPVPEGQVRELMLLLHGVYTASLPARLQPTLPERFAMSPNQPNPFTASTLLRFALPVATHVRLEVLDPQGRRVRVLADRYMAAGQHAIEWDGRTEVGHPAGPGVYFYRVQAGEFHARGRMTRVP